MSAELFAEYVEHIADRRLGQRKNSPTSMRSSGRQSSWAGTQSSLSLVYLTGAGTLLAGPVGVAGIGAPLLATDACIVHHRYVAAGRVTAGGLLESW